MADQTATAYGNGTRIQDLAHNASDQASLALQRVMQETERLRAENEEMRQLADVKIGSNGFDGANMAALWRIAGIFSKANILPKHFNGNRENCFIILGLAQRLRIDPFALMQKAYMVHGKVGLEAQAVIAIANRSGRLKGGIKFELSGQGDSRQCRAYAILDDGGMVEEIMSVQIAKQMGWWGKPDSLWPKMPDLMLRYRAASWLCRLHLPDIMLGVEFADELRDRGPEDDSTVGVAASKVRGIVDQVPAVTQPQPQPAPVNVVAPKPVAESLPATNRTATEIIQADILPMLSEFLGGDSSGIAKTVKDVFGCQYTHLERQPAAALEAKIPTLKAYLEALPEA